MKYTKKNIQKNLEKFNLCMAYLLFIFFYYFKWKTIHKICNENKKIIFNVYDTNTFSENIDTLDFYNISSNSDIFNYHAFKKK